MTQTLSWTELWADANDPVEDELRALGFRETTPGMLDSGTATIAVRRDADPVHDAFVANHGSGVGCIWLAGLDRATTLDACAKAGISPIARTHPVTGELRPAVPLLGDVLVGLEDPSDRIPHSTDTDPAQDVISVDHFAVCLPRGELATTCALLERALGLQDIFEANIVVGRQAMVSKVMQSHDRSLTLTIIEPGGGDPGQIDNYLERNRGAGIQHIAVLVRDALDAVDSASARGVHFLSTPDAYYRNLPEGLGLRHAISDLADRGLLVDTDDHGALYQVFTESRLPRRTLFYEVIERDGARTFGTGNIRALYEAVEQEETK